MSKMNVSVEHLSTSLYDDFAWRRKELRVFNSVIPTTPNDNQKIFIRAGGMLLYAHWEGFIRSAASDYLQHVAMQRLNHEDLQPQFVALCLKAKINNFASGNITDQMAVVEFMRTQSDKRAAIPYKKMIDTRSNLTFSVLSEILHLLGLDINNYRDKRYIINDLVATRNNIAHGKNTNFSYQDYQKTFTDIDDLINTIHADISNAATMKLYKLQTSA